MDEIVNSVTKEEIQCISIIDADQFTEAWIWFKAEINFRPTLMDGACYIFDIKRWGNDPPQNLSSDSSVVNNLACLYLGSQLAGDIEDLLHMVCDSIPYQVCIFTNQLDQDIKVVIESEDRFRDALSESLAFWVHLTSLLQSTDLIEFALSLPNFQPEDKGPDGLSIAFDNTMNPQVEIRSAKNSINDPYYLVASANFRKNGDKPDKKKLIEEFHLISKQGYGFSRLDRLLAGLLHTIKQPANQRIRAGLLGHKMAFNAVVVADDQHARYEMFSCYHRVSDVPEDCIGTYIGSESWKQLAESVRVQVIRILETAGAW